MTKMTEEDLRSVVSGEIRRAAGYLGGELSDERQLAMNYYNGKPFGNEVDGRSQVVSTDVADVVESMLPDFMEIFAGNEEVGRFAPMQPEDEAVADQATDYINFIWHNDNDGFTNTHDFIKDALLQKQGVFKIWWDDSKATVKDTLTNVTTDSLAQLAEDPEVEIVEFTERDAEGDEIQFAPDGKLYDVTIRRTTSNGRVKVVAVPPEEFLISRRATDMVDAPFTAHKVRRTVTELIEQGYKRDVVENIPEGDEQETNSERQARFAEDQDWPYGDSNGDPSMREVWVYECYIRVDYDGDGLAEMRQVVMAGPGYELLENEEVDAHPFVAASPVRIPHKVIGKAVADLVLDLQLIKSTIQRQLLDNMYLANNGRNAINASVVNLDDMLTNRPGGVVRVDGDPATSIFPLVTPPIGPHAYPMLEYFDGIREIRTGVTRYSQGLDAESLNKTATGINQIMGRSEKRMLMIARLIAEHGHKPAFKRILKLITAHQDRPRVIRLRNQWVPIDPRSWNADMDLSVTVGLGGGTKQQQAMLMRMLLDIQEKIIAFQGGAQGPLVNLENVYTALTKFTNALGFKNAGQFFTDPAGQPPPAPKQNPLVEIEQAKVQADIQKKQADAQLDIQKFQAQMAMEREKMGADIAMAREKMMADIALEREKMHAEFEIKRTDAAMKAALARDVAAHKAAQPQAPVGAN